MNLFPTALAEEAAEESTSFLSELLERLSDLGATGWITLFTLIILAAIMVGMSISRKTWTAKSLAYAALSIALAFVLSYVKLFRMPNSGSVTLASMLPLMLFSASYGVGPGLLAGAAYGLLQYLQGGYFVHPIQFLLDYPLAFALIGLTGLYLKPVYGWIQLVLSDIFLIIQFIAHPEKADPLSQFIMCMITFTLAAVMFCLVIGRGRSFIERSRMRTQEAEELLKSMNTVGLELEQNKAK